MACESQAITSTFDLKMTGCDIYLGTSVRCRRGNGNDAHADLVGTVSVVFPAKSDNIFHHETVKQPDI